MTSTEIKNTRETSLVRGIQFEPEQPDRDMHKAVEYIKIRCRREIKNRDLRIIQTVRSKQ